jgi:hypothetical protein
MDSNIHLNFDMPMDLNIDLLKLHRLSFISNAIDAGWTVKKRDDKYIFTKKHEGKKEVYLETYVRKFVESNLNLNNLDVRNA